jgi:hypothetical protein
MSDNDLGVARGAARTVLWFAAALLAAAFGWYAWVDAPLSNLALLLFSAATVCGAVTIIAALLAIESGLPLPGEGAANVAAALARSMRLRRIALLFLAVAVVQMLASATLTLSLQGQAGDPQDDTTVSA